MKNSKERKTKTLQPFITCLLLSALVPFKRGVVWTLGRDPIASLSSNRPGCQGSGLWGHSGSFH